MDNDGALLEVLRNTYKGLRFRWKYRGLIILPAEQGNAAAADAIRAGQPFLFGRCGATEMRTVAEYLTGKYTEKTRGEINTLSGVFPTDDKALNRFCKLYTSCAQGADLLALWDVGAERQVIDGCHGTRFTQLRALEPYYYANPWSAALAGKHVLVVHPFADTIRAQYQKRGELFTNAPGGVNTLPELASLTVIPAVQGLAGQKTGYDTWFDALAAMEKQMDACDYEVAIIGAGAYGLPLAAHARDTGHVAIQMSALRSCCLASRAAGGTPTPKSASCITLHGCAPPPPNSPPTSRRWRVAATGRTCAPNITL